MDKIIFVFIPQFFHRIISLNLNFGDGGRGVGKRERIGRTKKETKKCKLTESKKILIILAIK